MFTEAQFTEAMERAVAKRGENWTYPSIEKAPPGFYSEQGCPTYSDKNGNPTCLIAAAMFEVGMSVPSNDTHMSSLGAMGHRVPPAVALAARCAQVHQDQRNTWGASLSVYKAALRIAKERGYESPYGAMDIYYEVTMGKPAYTSLPKISVTVSGSAFNVQQFSAAMISLSTAITAVNLSIDTIQPLKKKDHALIA